MAINKLELWFSLASLLPAPTPRRVQLLRLSYVFNLASELEKKSFILTYIYGASDRPTEQIHFYKCEINFIFKPYKT